MTEDPVNLDIIIVGGGLSGLVAAYRVLQKVPSLNILLLEASDRLGGRILTLPVKVLHDQYSGFDLGGQWISSNQLHIKELIEEFNLELTSSAPTGKKVVEINHNEIETYETELPYIKSFIPVDEFYEVFSKLDDMAVDVSLNGRNKVGNSQNLDAMSMEMFLQNEFKSDAARKLFRAFIESTFGVEARKISLLYYLGFSNGTLGASNQLLYSGGGAREFSIKGGAQELCNQLIHQIDHECIITGDGVKIIITDQSECTVITNSNKRYKSQYVIIAIPFKDILEIQFKPQLCDFRMNLLKNINESSIIKFVASYPEAYWKTNGYSGDFLSAQGPILQVSDGTHKTFPALICFAQANFKYKDFKTEILSQLVCLGGQKMLDPIDFIHEKWSNYKPSPSLSTFEDFIKFKTNFNRIYWAGAETATNWNGYMNGAIQTGHRAAIEVLLDLRPQAISWTDINSIDHRMKPIKRYDFYSRYSQGLQKAGMILAIVIGTYAIYKGISKLNNK